MSTFILKSIDKFNELRSGESFYSEFKTLKEIEKLPNEKIIDMRNNKLKKILNHAYKNVPLYRELWEKNQIDPSNFKNYEDLEKYPIITKDLIRANFPKNILADNLRSRAAYDTTSGSTGNPLEFYSDKRAESKRIASYMFFNTWMNVEPFEKHLHIKTVVKSPLSQKVWFWILQKKLLSVLDINKEKIPFIVSLINGLKARYFEGYSASLVKLATLFNENEVKLKETPKSIIATSENLFENQRELIQDVFNCKVYNRYGSREFSGAVAQECSYFNGLHVNPNLCYLEVVGKENNILDSGKEGRILITDLNNYAMPFIRFEIGDMGVLVEDDCNCGRKFQNLKKIIGRSGEFLISQFDEKIPLLPISSGVFSSKYTPYVSMFQFIQPNKGELVIKLVPTKKYKEEVGREIEDIIKNRINFKTEIQIVSEILPEPSGKIPILIKKF